jgi:hypothetical protein
MAPSVRQTRSVPENCKDKDRSSSTSQKINTARESERRERERKKERDEHCPCAHWMRFEPGWILCAFHFFSVFSKQFCTE